MSSGTAVSAGTAGSPETGVSSGTVSSAVLLFVGVAASSSFEHASELGLSPGQSTSVGSYEIRYVRPTATITPRYDQAHTGSTLSLGAVLAFAGEHTAGR